MTKWSGLAAREAAWLTVAATLFGMTIVAVATGQVGKFGSVLWSEEAAGWASAFGTVFAAFVALGIALSEVRSRERARKDQQQITVTLLSFLLREFRGCLYQLRGSPVIKKGDLADKDGLKKLEQSASHLYLVTSQIEPMLVHLAQQDAEKLAGAIALGRHVASNALRIVPADMEATMVLFGLRQFLQEEATAAIDVLNPYAEQSDRAMERATGYAPDYERDMYEGVDDVDHR